MGIRGITVYGNDPYFKCARCLVVPFRNIVLRGVEQRSIPGLTSIPNGDTIRRRPICQRYGDTRNVGRVRYTAYQVLFCEAGTLSYCAREHHSENVAGTRGERAPARSIVLISRSFSDLV